MVRPNESNAPGIRALCAISFVSSPGIARGDTRRRRNRARCRTGSLVAGLGVVIHVDEDPISALEEAHSDVASSQGLLFGSVGGAEPD